MNSPIADDRDVVRFILHRVQDVTTEHSAFAGLVATATAAAGGLELPPQEHEASISATQKRWIDADPSGELAEQIAELRRLLDARTVIEQAKGMLMASQRITAQEAFALLRAESQFTNEKLRVVAERHVVLHSAPTRIPPQRRASD